MSVNLTLNPSKKNLTFSDLKEQLEFLRDRRVDVVVNSSELEVLSPKAIQTPYLDSVITSSGVGVPAREWGLSNHALQQWAAKFGVPNKYLSGLFNQDIVSFNELGMDIMRTHMYQDPKDIMIRGFVDELDGYHFCRAILSPSYSFIENYDVLIAVFQGLNQVREEQGIGFEPAQASINDRHMRARINMPELKTVSEALLRNYTSPHSGQSGLDNPVVFFFY